MIFKQSKITVFIINIVISAFLVSSCSIIENSTAQPETEISIPVAATQTPLPTIMPTPKQLFALAQSSGPERENFPTGYNPLSGLPVKDPNLLTYPAMLISISHFPPAARPQAGLSFAPWVFEFYITEGATRFLSVFHGVFPEPEIPVTGNCEIRKGVFSQTSNILGNQVWLDENKDGRREPYEPGIGGICINLYDASGQLVESTTTDSNGYYGFNLNAQKYTVEFKLPDWLAFTNQNVGDEGTDSDADPISGRVDADVRSTILYLDAGLIPSEQGILNPSASTQLPKAEIGPVRSGRLIYADIAAFFRSSCLIYAFASEEVLSEIPHCSFVTHNIAGGGSMLQLDRFKAIAEDNKKHTSNDFNYASNFFTQDAPPGGVPASQVNVYVALLNQSGWTYDPLYESWLRSVDDADIATAGQLHLEADRLTGRQLHFENVIIINAEHDVITPTNLDIHLELGSGGFATLFRDGKKYDIRWDTTAGEFEKKTGQSRPIKFVNADGSPSALKPGSTWIFVATPYSVLSGAANGVWNFRYYPPQGAK
jgi:SdrD B-like domain/Protein of unknown function (DUF3048) C-terminal domain